MARVPNINPGGLSIPSGYVLGRVSPGTGQQELISIGDLGRVMVAQSIVPPHGSPTSITLTQPAAGLSITGGPSAFTFALANDLAALEGLGSTGIAVRTGSDAWAQRTIIAPAAGITVTNGSGAAGNPTLVLADDLAALEAQSGTGLVARTAANTYAHRTITPPAAGIGVSNGDGVSGNPTISLANDLAAVEGIAGIGIAVRTATDAWTSRTISAGSAKITVANGDGVAGNPTINLGSVAASDLSNGVTGSGAVVLANTPTLITPVIGAATGTSLALSSPPLISGVSQDIGIGGTGGIGVSRLSANTTAPQLRLAKSRGSISTPGAVVAGDRLLDLQGFGDDGSTAGNITVQSAILRAQVIGTVSAGVVPAFFAIHTMNAAGVTAERVRFSAEGGVDIGGTSEPGSGNLSIAGALTVGGDLITLGGDFATSGAFDTTLTVTGDTNVTLPTTGTLATLAGSETLTNKTLTSPTINTGVIGFAVSDGLTATGSNRATALVLASQFNIVTTAAAGTGVLLQADTTGRPVFVFNYGANLIKVYATGSDTVDTVAGSTGVNLSAGARAMFFPKAADTYISALLGAVSA